MISSSPTPQRHGWPKSAPPKSILDASPENPGSNPASHESKRRYSLPAHQFLRGSMSKETQRGEHSKLSINAQIPLRHSKVTDVQNSRVSLPLPFPSSREEGNKRAVVIAATYKGTQGISQKFEKISHIRSLFRLLTITLNFKKENVWMLTDAPEMAVGCPVKLSATRRNILTSLKWLVGGSRDGDVLFFAFSGLGATLTLQDSQSHQVSEDCLLPTDYPASSPIAQTYLASLIATSLHVNASLTALIDTRDCSKVLKLPYIKNVYCVSRKKFVISEPTDDQEPTEDLFTLKYNRVKREYSRMRKLLEKEERDALVSKFSHNGKVFAFGFAGASEADPKTSKRKPVTVGALSQAFTDCILCHNKARKDITYAYVLRSMCAAVATKRKSQLPHIASSHGFDLYATMAMVEETRSK